MMSLRSLIMTISRKRTSVATPVVTKRAFETYLPNTEISVRIPKGTKGRVIKRLRGNVMLVQFDVEALGPLRVEAEDLLSAESLEAVLEEMQMLMSEKGFTAIDKQKGADELVVRALRILANEDQRGETEKLIRLFLSIPRPYKPKPD